MNPSARSKRTFRGCIEWFFTSLLFMVGWAWFSLVQAQTMTIPGQFAVSPSGAATYTVPIQVPPGVGGMEPKLSLVYNSQGGNGMVGLGWSLSGLSVITRCSRTLGQDGVAGSVNFDYNDRYCLDGQRLILVSGTYGAAGSEYRTEIDSYSKITAFGGAGNGVAYFLVKMKSGILMEFGATSDSRIDAIKAPLSTASWPAGTVREWALNKIIDIQGNYLSVAYTKDSVNGAYYPSRIDYAGNARVSPAVPTSSSVRFDWGSADRPDVVAFYHAGAVMKAVKRLSNIRVFSGADLVKDYSLEYISQNSREQPSRVLKLNACGQNKQCQVPTQIGYSGNLSGGVGEVTTGPYSSLSGTGYGYGWSMVQMDVDGDGRTDMVAYYKGMNDVIYIQAFLANGDGTYRAGPYNAPFSLEYAYGMSITPSDVNGDGKTDLVASFIGGEEEGIRFQAFISNGDGTYRLGSYSPLIAPGYGYGWSLTSMDVNGDGKTDMVAYLIGVNRGIRIQAFLSNGDGTYRQGFYNMPYEVGYEEDWAMMPMDVNGDGKSDIVAYSVGINQGIRVQAFVSGGDGSFSAGPYKVLLTAGYGPGWAVRPVDVNGDGKSDLVAFYIGKNAGIHMQAFISSGDGGFIAGVYNAPFTSGYGYGWSMIPMDVNGDGKTDMVAYLIGVDAGIRIQAFLSVGDGSYVTGVYNAPYTTSYGSYWRMGAADVNGDGKSDLVAYFIGANAGVYVQPFTSKFGSVAVASISAVDGSNIELIYSSLSSASGVYVKDSGLNASTYPRQDLQLPIYVVSAVRRSNGAGGMALTSYGYGGLKAEQGAGRGFLGFRWMKAKEDATGIETYTEFRQDFPFIGVPIKSETRLVNGSSSVLLKRSTFQLDCRVTAQAGVGLLSNASTGCSVAPGKVYFPYVSLSEEESWDLNGVQMPRIRTSTSYSGVTDSSGVLRQLGDPTQLTVELYEGGTLRHRKTTSNEYAPPNTSTWTQLGRLRKATVMSSNY